MKVGDKFVSPTGPWERFPEREMTVIETMTIMDETWVDATPVRRLPGDQFWHCTYRFDKDNHVLPV